MLSKTWIIIISILVVIVLLVMGVFSTYNGMNSAFLEVDRAAGQVEAVYQRRFDLIPNLVASVQGIMTQEKEVFGKLADARSKYAGASTSIEKSEAAGEVDSALARLLVITENYPELKSSEAVQDLMTQLEGTENRISVERQRYNDSVTEYNKIVTQIPGLFFAKMFGFEKRQLFNAVPEADQAPSVKL